MAKLIIDLMTLVFLIFFLINSTRLIHRMTKRIETLASLIDFVASGLCNPWNREMYKIFKEKGVIDIKDQINFMRKYTEERYSSARKSIVDIIEKGPLEHKIKAERILEEMDSTFTLISSLDEKSSKDYTIMIMGNIINSIEKLRKNIDES